MKQLGHLKTYKMKLTTLSPIFIGGGEFSDLSQLQYVLTKDNELKIIDESKFMKFLIKSNPSITPNQTAAALATPLLFLHPIAIAANTKFGIYLTLPLTTPTIYPFIRA